MQTALIVCTRQSLPGQAPSRPPRSRRLCSAARQSKDSGALQKQLQLQPALPKNDAHSPPLCKAPHDNALHGHGVCPKPAARRILYSKLGSPWSLDTACPPAAHAVALAPSLATLVAVHSNTQGAQGQTLAARRHPQPLDMCQPGAVSKNSRLVRLEEDNMQSIGRRTLLKAAAATGPIPPTLQCPKAAACCEEP